MANGKALGMSKGKALGMTAMRMLAAAACLAGFAMNPVGAQHDMAAHHSGPLPSFPGQAAFTTIGEVVAILKADSSTDWSKVNLDALREHLIDMDDVVMHASVAKKNVAGGFEARVTGTGRTVQAIRRMLTNHAAMLDMDSPYHAVAAEIPNGARLTVTAKNASDASQVAHIRGLGFAGILTEGDHHPRHHLAIARGDAQAHER
jgi:hypothetical protein